MVSNVLNRRLRRTFPALLDTGADVAVRSQAARNRSLGYSADTFSKWAQGQANAG